MSAGTAALTMRRSRIRAFIERLLPWYDIAAEDRGRAALRVEIAASAAARGRAVRAIQRSSVGMDHGYRAYGERLEH